MTIQDVRRQAGGWISHLPLVARLRSNSFLRNAGVLSGGSALGHVFTLAAGPLLTRIYGPGDFGTLGLFTSYFAVAGVAVALQYEASIVSAADELEAAYLTWTAALLAIPTSLLAGIVLWVLVRFSIMGFQVLSWYGPILLTLAMYFVGVFGVLRYWNLRRQQFAQVSQATVVQSAIRAILQCLFGVLGMRTSGLVLAETLGRGMGMGRMFRDAWPELRGYVNRFHWAEWKAILWKNRKFPLFSLPSSLMDALCVSLSLPLLIQLYGAQTGGYYSLVWRAIALPSVLITLAVADTFHSRVAACVREEPANVFPLFVRTSVSLLLAGMVPCLFMFFWAEPVFGLVFGKLWTISGKMAVLISPWFLSQFVVNPVSRIVLVLNGQETKLVWDILCIIAIPTLFYVARLHHLEALQTVKWLSIVSTLLYVAYYGTLLRVISTYNKTLKLPGTRAALSEELV